MILLLFMQNPHETVINMFFPTKKQIQKKYTEFQVFVYFFVCCKKKQTVIIDASHPKPKKKKKLNAKIKKTI